MKNMRERLFIATFSGGALETIKENKLNIEINHTCISEALDDENRIRLLGEIRKDIEECGAQRVLVHGPFTEIIPAAIDYKAREFALERLEQSCQVAASVGAEAMIVHSGYIPFMYFKESGRRKNQQCSGRNLCQTSLQISVFMWKMCLRTSLICWLK